jgi:hypothetical protein
LEGLFPLREGHTDAAPARDLMQTLQSLRWAFGRAIPPCSPLSWHGGVPLPFMVKLMAHIDFGVLPVSFVMLIDSQWNLTQYFDSLLETLHENKKGNAWWSLRYGGAPRFVPAQTQQVLL